jgi:3-deoxy-7-phosphoheptulonate synthase
MMDLGSLWNTGMETRIERKMLVVMRHRASTKEVERVVSTIESMGYQARAMPGAQRTAVGLVGNDGRVDASRLAALPGVKEIIHVTQPYKQVSREWRDEPTVVRLPGGLSVGGRAVVVIAGPCSVESESQILKAAREVRESGACILRGGAFKPRSSPYSFQGLGLKGLKLLARAREETGLLVVTEAIDAESVDLVASYADIIQIGARNMQNFSLLKRAGKAGKPVLLKRGLAATITELLLSAEYVLAEGNQEVILCERGIRSFDNATRNVFDLAAIPVVHSLSHLPIIADPSHATGRREKVIPMARAAVAAGADGIMVEVHPAPDTALSDGAQSLYPEQFADLMRQARVIAEASGRELAEPLVRQAPQ